MATTRRAPVVIAAEQKGSRGVIVWAHPELVPADRVLEAAMSASWPQLLRAVVWPAAAD